MLHLASLMAPNVFMLHTIIPRMVATSGIIFSSRATGATSSSIVSVLEAPLRLESACANPVTY